VVPENAQTITAAIKVLSLFVDTGIDLYPESGRKVFWYQSISKNIFYSQKTQFLTFPLKSKPWREQVQVEAVTGKLLVKCDRISGVKGRGLLSSLLVT
jgi:hypothetical protein